MATAKFHTRTWSAGWCQVMELRGKAEVVSSGFQDDQISPAGPLAGPRSIPDDVTGCK